ncbi:helix-turn-helix domain-containing protein [Butyrivibrio sp. WCD3002]|uniref:helix-turn-helix domain-containing protein n=1 Tax=Butyrivibrio sp. WCD3002 TaxID=1280676 RepID=UPI000478B0A5|nr:helix-turn-helix domain-containing protein [Butyrivibrio sp. WCD3002]
MNKKDTTEYMNTAIAADLFDVNKSTVAKYCREGKIKGCTKVDGKWMIPSKSIKPLTQKQTVTILQDLLIIKNNKAENEELPDYALELVYKYLYDQGYIISYKTKKGNILKPRKIKLTEKGMNLALKGDRKLDKINPEAIEKFVTMVVQLASLYLQYKAIK